MVIGEVSAPVVERLEEQGQQLNELLASNTSLDQTDLQVSVFCKLL